MKRSYTFFLLILVSFAVMAQNYGIMVNDKDYYAGTPNPSPLDPSFQEVMVLNVSLKNGDKVQLYDAENKAGWAVVLDEASVPTCVLSADYYSITSDGCYDFYIKLKYENDQLYVGEGKDCGNSGTQPTDPSNPGYSTSAPAKYPGVMLQAFYWDSYTDKGHGRTMWTDFVNPKTAGAQSQAGEIGQWFDLIWLPPSAQADGTGYLPKQYSNQSSKWGSKTILLQLIDSLHQNGARVVADMVVNHVNSTSGWCTLAKEDFTPYGTFSPTMEWICNSDEANTGKHCSSTFGGNDDGYDGESNYEAGRDWCHSQKEVRDMMNAYAKWMVNVIGYDGFRYDYCKGFHMSHVNEYNTNGKAFFSVLEYWDGNVNTLQSRLSDAQWNTTTFDFATKYQAFNDGIASGNYGGCKGAGLLGAGKGRYAVTFIDSHDSYQRDGNEFMGPGNSMKNYDGKTMQANAYILCMPGTPCVFYPHWVTWKEDIKKLINARYKAGVHNESAVSDEAGNGFYKATITGTNGQLRLLIGPNSGYDTTPSGFTLAAKGTNWGVYYTETTPRGNKNEHRTPIVKGATESAVTIVEVQKPRGEKVLRNGQLYLVVDGVEFDIMGRRL